MHITTLAELNINLFKTKSKTTNSNLTNENSGEKYANKIKTNS